MERTEKCSLIALSVVQIIMSAVFLTLGLVDGLKIRYGSASLLYKPCWLAALVSGQRTWVQAMSPFKSIKSSLLSPLFFIFMCLKFVTVYLVIIQIRLICFRTLKQRLENLNCCTVMEDYLGKGIKYNFEFRKVLVYIQLVGKTIWAKGF